MSLFCGASRRREIRFMLQRKRADPAETWSTSRSVLTESGPWTGRRNEQPRLGPYRQRNSPSPNAQPRGQGQVRRQPALCTDPNLHFPSAAYTMTNCPADPSVPGAIREVMM